MPTKMARRGYNKLLPGFVRSQTLIKGGGAVFCCFREEEELLPCCQNCSYMNCNSVF